MIATGSREEISFGGGKAQLLQHYIIRAFVFQVVNLFFLVQGVGISRNIPPRETIEQLSFPAGNDRGVVRVFIGPTCDLKVVIVFLRIRGLGTELQDP